jgi:hypothetical protein
MRLPGPKNPKNKQNLRPVAKVGLGNRGSLAYCYWNWGLLAREQHDHDMESEKLTAALDLFTELKMPRERDEVRAELEKTTAKTVN